MEGQAVCNMEHIIPTRNDLMRTYLLGRRNCFAWEFFRFLEAILLFTADFEEAGCSIDTGLEQEKIFTLFTSILLTISSPLSVFSCLVN